MNITQAPSLISLRNALLGVFFFAICAGASQRVVGANQTLYLNPSAVSAAEGDAVLALPGSALSAGLNPVGTLDQRFPVLGLSHTALYEGTKLDAVSGVYDLDSLTRIAAVFMRFGADDIPWIKEGDAIPNDGEWRTLSIFDYTMSLVLAHTLPFHLDAALATHFLYRELDQSGFGFRSDASMRWRPLSSWFLTGKVEGWTSSAARWESGQLEYSPVDLILATGGQWNVPYLYGRVSIGYQSPGVFQQGNPWMSIGTSVLEDTSDANLTSLSLGGGRVWEHPVDWLRDGAVGAELAMDWGGAIRLGWQSLREIDSWSVGGGVTLFGWLTADYAYQRHPVLSGVHRVSLSVSPWWLTAPQRVIEPTKIFPTETASPVDSTSTLKHTPEAQDSIPSSLAPPAIPEPAESSGNSWEE